MLTNYGLPRYKLSTTGQIALSLGCLLFFSLVMAGSNYMAMKQERERLDGFASDRATATGTVTRKYKEMMNGSPIGYDLEVSFTAENGSTPNQSFRVAVADFDRFNVGNPVPVSYVSSNPYWFYIPGAEPDGSNLEFLRWLEKLFVGGSILLAVGFLASLCVAGKAGRPAAADGEPRPTRASIGQTPGASRTSFGTRQLGR
jgi:hypothetical protein